MRSFLTLGILLLCINIFGQDCFEIGSSQSTVRNIQGTPSAINDYNLFIVWSYGSSSVTFKNGKIKSYNNLSNNLKICRTDNYQKFPNQNNSRSQTQTATNKIDSKFGFRDLILESTFSSIDNKYNLIPLKYELTKKIKSYFVYDFPPIDDDIIIDKIKLEFVDGKLYCITLIIECNQAVTKLTKLIEENYGKLKENSEKHEYFIKGNKAELFYSIRGKSLGNGRYSNSLFANVKIRSMNLKKKITGSNTGF